MYSWDDLLPILTNPYFIALIAVSVLIEPFIRFLRRFYPESMKRAVTESEKIREKMKKEEGILLQRAYLKIVFAVLALPIAMFLLNSYICYRPAGSCDYRAYAILLQNIRP